MNRNTNHLIVSGLSGLTSCVFLLLPCISFSQSNTELFRLADQAFSAENYTSAAFFYKKILVGGDSSSREMAYPYELKYFNKLPAKSGKKKREAPTTDSLRVDSTIYTAKDSVSKTSSGTFISVAEESSPMVYVMERLAESYRLSFDYNNTELWYKKLYDMKTPYSDYWYANALMKNYKYAEALDVLTDFIEKEDTSSDYFKKAESDIKRCSYAITAMQKPEKGLDVRKADSTINHGQTNFGATFYGDNTVLFASTRSVVVQGTDVLPPNNNIYTAIFENGRFSEIKNMGAPLNSPANEAAIAVSPDKSKIFFTRWNNDIKNPECAIYVSKNLHGQWLSPKKLSEKINMPGTKTMHPALSPDGGTLFFVSNRQNGTGKLDIWYCTIDEFDNPGEVKNLGNNVNTSENESTPFFHKESNTFYFSSDGHIGMGGLDIFRTYPDNEFNAPVENMGYPVNSSRDDAYYVTDSENKFGMFASDRDSCTDCTGGSCYQIYMVSVTPIIITISGKVYNAETNKLIANAMVAFNEIKERFEPIYVFTDESGFYKCVLKRELEFFSTAQKSKFFKDATTLNTMNISQSTNLTHDFYLKPIPEGDIVIQGIEYDLNKATLRPESKKKLDELIEFLKLNDNIIIEISSHTDIRGNDDYNLKLSEARAQSVVDYLNEHEIHKERLVAKGYGETKPEIVDAKTEEEHQRNRRTAFRTLSEDYKPIKKYKYLPKKK